MHSTLLINMNLGDKQFNKETFFLRNDKGYFKNRAKNIY